MQVSSGMTIKECQERLRGMSYRDFLEIEPYLTDKQRERAVDAVRRNAWYAFYNVDDVEAIEKSRLEWIKQAEEMKYFQTLCAKNKDFESAKFFKEEWSWANKHYRGTCLVLGHLLSDPPGDCPFIPTSEWPLELCDYAVSAIR